MLADIFRKSKVRKGWTPPMKEENKMVSTATTARQETTQVPLNELKKRQTVLTAERGTVQISIPRMQLTGLPQVRVNRKQKDKQIEKEVAQRGLSADAYREKPDTGFCVIDDVEEVSLEYIIDQLLLVGLFYCGGRVEWWWQENGKFASKSVLEFSADPSRKQELPSSAQNTLKTRVFRIFVWANWKFRDEEKGRAGGQYRLDTINCAEQRILGSEQKPLRHLNVRGNTYDVQEG